MESMTNRLMKLCTPLFHSLRCLQRTESENLPQSFGEELYQGILALEHQSLEFQIPSHFMTEAKYALAALLDEAVMRSSWPGRHHWMDKSLQFRLFGEHLAGVNFFERLNKIRQGGDLNLPVLEVFFVCLQLGFQGKYALSQQEELLALQSSLKHQLDLYKGVFNPCLTIESESQQDKSVQEKSRIPAWTSLAAGALFLVVLYAGYGFRFSALHQEHTIAGQLAEKVSP